VPPARDDRKTYPHRLWAKLFVPLPDERGAVVGGMLIARDVTEQRRAERQLLASGRRLLGRVYEAQEGQDRRLAADPHDGHVQRLGRLRPLVLVEDGLEAALREEAKLACNRAALVACEVTSELDGRLDPVVETALFRVAQQALANVVDHAKAAHVLVAITCTEAGALLRVSDDGVGFDPDHVQVIGDIAHFGLIAMRERVEALGGGFRVTTAPGQGTVVEARLPLTDPAEWRWGA
jgi:signal transduction histidine kinase